MKVLYALPFVIATAASADNCMADYKQENFNTYDWSTAAACISKKRTAEREIKTAELREFLKENPRYRFPGQSWNKCFSKAKQNGIAKIEKTPFSTTLYYREYIETCIDVEK